MSSSFSRFRGNINITGFAGDFSRTFRGVGFMDINGLTDPFVGIIRGIHAVPEIPGEPYALARWTATAADLGRVLRWTPDLHGTGFAFSETTARYAAIGEAIERYAGNCPEKNTIQASINELADIGKNHYSPLGEPMFLDSQYEQPGFPFKRLGRDDRIDWVEGEQMVPDSAPVLLPAALVYLNYYRSVSSEQPTRHFPVLMSGIAAGQDRERAILSALLEVFERDTLMLWWYGNLDATTIDIAGDSELRSTLMDGVGDTISLHHLLLPSDHPVPVVVSVLISEAEDVLVIGSSASFDIGAAILKASAEAFQLRRLSLALRDPGSWLWSGQEAGTIRFPLRPFRRDLRYGDSFSDDFFDMTQLMHNSQYYLDRRTWPNALRRLTGNRTEALSDLQDSGRAKAGSVSRPDDLAEYLRVANMATYICDVTTQDVASSGCSVFRVLVPRAMGNNPSSIPMLGNRRLQALCAQSGAPPFVVPMPHS
jgi:ribosomal protein S12 methylthiotransferase accessory factor